MKQNNLIQKLSNWIEERRSLKMARTNVKDLFKIPPQVSSRQTPSDWMEGLSESVWNSTLCHGNVNQKQEVFSRAYFGGVQHSIRGDVWPYLLEHYEFGSTAEDRKDLDLKTQQLYDELVSEWSEIEEPSRHQREKTFASYMSDISMDSQNEALTDSPDSSHSEPESTSQSIASSNGSVYSEDFLENFGLNLDRIDKDVERCDRFHPYFQEVNLEKLRKVVCTYVFKNLDLGYKQGMCDMAAPLLVLFDDEAMTYACFSRLMSHMTNTFFNGSSMPKLYHHMSSLIQISDAELFEHLRGAGECMYFFFCYRWFLLNFKRELKYEDIFNVWEAIWSARFVSSNNFGLFIALALVQIHRKNIIDGEMDFTDIFKHFNDLALTHDTKVVLQTARTLVSNLWTL